MHRRDQRVGQRHDRRLRAEPRQPGAGRHLQAQRQRQRLLERRERLRVRGQPEGPVLRVRHARAAALPRVRRLPRRQHRHLQRHGSEVLPAGRADLQHRRRVLRARAVRPRRDRRAPLPGVQAGRRHRVRRFGRHVHRDGRLLHRAGLQHHAGRAQRQVRPAPDAQRRRRLRALRPGLQRGDALLQQRAMHLLGDQHRCNGQTGCTCYNPITSDSRARRRPRGRRDGGAPRSGPTEVRSRRPPLERIAVGRTGRCPTSLHDRPSARLDSASEHHVDRGHRSPWHAPCAVTISMADAPHDPAKRSRF